MARLTRSTTAEITPMSRTGLLAVLGVAAALACLLLYGLGYSLYAAAILPPTLSQDPRSDPANSGVSIRDEIAARAMLTVGADAGRIPQVAISQPASVRLPPSTGTGPGNVPAGFPHTAEGAAAQLAAIDAHVLTTMSIPVATDSYDAWALPGGVGATNWNLTRNVQSFLTGAGQQSTSKDLATSIRVTPAAYQIKGTDGPDWVLACVLFDVEATIRDTARMGYGTCERMQWATDRWLIGAGDAPAAAPSTWPGSDLASRAGWIPLDRN